jgi:hypothetical protein
MLFARAGLPRVDPAIFTKLHEVAALGRSIGPSGEANQKPRIELRVLFPREKICLISQTKGQSVTCPAIFFRQEPNVADKQDQGSRHGGG